MYRPETLNRGFYNPCGGFFLVKGTLVSPTTDNTEKAFKNIAFVSDAKKQDISNIHEFISCCFFLIHFAIIIVDNVHTVLTVTSYIIAKKKGKRAIHTLAISLKKRFS